MIAILHPFRDDLLDDYVPDDWTAEHVERRLVEAYAILRRMPDRNLRPRAFGNLWPEYQSEWADLLAQVGMSDPGRECQMHLPPTSIEIANMERALDWPISYLRGYDEEARALSRRAMAKAAGIPLRAVARRTGGDERQLKRQAERGAHIIAVALARAGKPAW